VKNLKKMKTNSTKKLQLNSVYNCFTSICAITIIIVFSQVTTYANIPLAIKKTENNQLQFTNSFPVSHSLNAHANASFLDADSHDFREPLNFRMPHMKKEVNSMDINTYIFI
jgi:hypothetical protein